MRGTLELKVRIPGCDPIRRLSGTTDKGVLKALKRMVYTLAEQGRVDVVNAIARGTLHPLQVYNKFKFTRLEELPYADELPRYQDVWTRFLQDVEFSDDHHASLTGYYERLGRLMPKDATLADLPRALEEYRASHRSKARSFEYAQNAAARLVRHALGRRHQLYLAVRDLPGLRRVRKVKGHPLSADQLRDLVKGIGTPWGPMAWTMATTGMHWKEYVGEWYPEGVGLRIRGSKTQGRDRLIPLVSLLHPARGTYIQFRARLLKASPRITTYDLRRTYTNLMVEAGIPRPRRKQYLGHLPEDVTALYERMEVERFLVEDAERMRAVLGEPVGGPSLQLVRA